jgi:hypothetical protein
MDHIKTKSVCGEADLVQRLKAEGIALIPMDPRIKGKSGIAKREFKGYIYYYFFGEDNHYAMTPECMTDWLLDFYVGNPTTFEEVVAQN